MEWKYQLYSCHGCRLRNNFFFFFFYIFFFIFFFPLDQKRQDYRFTRPRTCKIYWVKRGRKGGVGDGDGGGGGAPRRLCFCYGLFRRVLRGKRRAPRPRTEGVGMRSGVIRNVLAEVEGTVLEFVLVVFRGFSDRIHQIISCFRSVFLFFKLITAEKITTHRFFC